jgi:hypothetical protein
MAVVHGARPAGVREDGGVYGENVRHGEERGRAGAELRREGRAARSQAKAPSDPGTLDGGVDTAKLRRRRLLVLLPIVGMMGGFAMAASGARVRDCGIARVWIF